MSCYSASIHLWMNEMLTVGLQPFKLWMNCFSGMVGFFALCYVELLWWSNVRQAVPMEHIAIFTCYADMKLTSVYSGKGFVFIRTFSFFFAAAAAPAWTIVLGYCNHSFNLVYLFFEIHVRCRCPKVCGSIIHIIAKSRSSLPLSLLL